jgi:NAD(P)-dependent dehydrogenase (short-subunit alcohol dehydrogenase family)
MSASGRQSIFITGAASGVGRATAVHFAQKGWLVGAYDVNDAGLETLQAELGAEACVIGHLDVASYAAYACALRGFSEASGGRLDVLFNNAGIARGGPFDEMKFEDVVAVVNVNLFGVLIGVHAAAALLKATPNSLCFSMSSATGVFGLPNMAVYAATKHAVKGFTESLSLELRKHGVRVADALPGLVDTPFIRRSIATHPDCSGMFRVLPPDEIAQIVWRAYHSERLHWYVPEDLHELSVSAAASAESVREQVAHKSGPFTWMRSLGA